MTEMLPDPPELDPVALASSEFTRTRRGLEATEVRALLGRAADALRTWQDRDSHLRATIEELTERLEESRELDEHRIASVLGEETTRIVTAAREAAAEIRTNAQDAADTLLAETEAQATAAADALRSEAQTLRDDAAAAHADAVAEATRLRDEASAAAAREREEAAALATSTVSDAQERSEQLLSSAGSVLEERTAEAEAVAAALTNAAQQVLDDAEASARVTRAEAEVSADGIIEAARTQAREMLAETREVRERMLRDLAEKRRAARRQIEGALAGRDRIVEVLREAGVEVNATISGLDRVDGEAAMAAGEAAATVGDDIDAEVDELRAELTEADDDVDSTRQMADDAPRPGASDGELAGTDPAEPQGDADEDAAVDGSADEGSSVESEGATVHDLFARIRAEGTDDADDADSDNQDSVDAEDGPGPRGTDADAAGPEPLAADLDESEGAEPDAADADRAVDGPDDAGTSGAGVQSPAAGDARPTPLASVGAIDLTTAAAATSGAVLADDRPADSTEAMLDRRDQVLVPIEKSLSRVLKRLASDEQNEILDRLRRVKRGRPDPAEVLPDDDRGHFVDALLVEYTKAAEAGGSFWAELAGAAVEALFADDDLVRTSLAERVEGFLGLHRTQLERLFAEADEADMDASELGDRIRASYRDWRSGSLADLAGDLAIAGFTFGERRAAGAGTPWRWVVDNGGLPCADGEDNALAGSVPCEEPFPTGDLTPPAHPGCRCILAPAHS